jgi:hypothetical protein
MGRVMMWPACKRIFRYEYELGRTARFATPVKDAGWAGPVKIASVIIRYLPN